MLRQFLRCRGSFRCPFGWLGDDWSGGRAVVASESRGDEQQRGEKQQRSVPGADHHGFRSGKANAIR